MLDILYYSEEFELKRRSSGASAFDLHARITDDDGRRVIPAGDRLLVDTGIYMKMPLGVNADIRPRGSGSKAGVEPSLGTIDSDYVGELRVNIRNFTRDDAIVEHGERIAQLIFFPVLLPDIAYTPTRTWDANRLWTLVRVDSLDKLPQTTRGAGGWGSTGK